MFEFAEITKDMTAAETLNYYRNLYYAEPQVTERGIVANAINDYFQEATPRAEVAREIFEEIEKSVALKMPAKIPPIFKHALGYDCGVIDGKRDALFGVLVLIAELKNKYAEGQK